MKLTGDRPAEQATNRPSGQQARQLFRTQTEMGTERKERERERDGGRDVER